MAWALIKNGVVVDRYRVHPTSILTEEYAAGFIEAPDDVDHGWLFDGETFTSPPEPEPAPAPPPPTKEELLTQLQALQAQITALGD
jgi:hypothetical protein